MKILSSFSLDSERSAGKCQVFAGWDLTHVLSCEIIRDKKTGDSLCYAFIEFDERESCEEAYFKMDNVLIDDRRIHVDFSQSVSKLHGDWIGMFIKYMMRIHQPFLLDSRKGRRGNDLELKAKYAEDSRGYEMVFEHEGDLTGEKREQYHLEASHKPQTPKVRDESRHRARDDARQRDQRNETRSERKRDEPYDRRQRNYRQDDNRRGRDDEGSRYPQDRRRRERSPRGRDY